MTKKKRLFSILVCCLLLFTLFFSMFFIAVELNHECTGKNCPVCLEIHACVQTLKAFGTAITAVAILHHILYKRLRTIRLPKLSDSFASLFLLKVKLNN